LFTELQAEFEGLIEVQHVEVAEHLLVLVTHNTDADCLEAEFVHFLLLAVDFGSVEDGSTLDGFVVIL
jgi:hypothetical protein